MKVLLFSTLLLLSYSLSAQPVGNDPGMWGPGEVGDCLTARELGIKRLYQWDLVRNSLYVSSNPFNYSESPTCLEKVADFPARVLRIDCNWWNRYRWLSVWTEEGEYQYNLETRELREVEPFGALTPFLAWPLAGIQASTSLAGCNGGRTREIEHQVSDVDVAVPSLRDEVRPMIDPTERGAAVNGVDAENLTRALQSVNQDPYRLPSFAEFNFDEEDLLAYQERVAENLEGLRDRAPLSELAMLVRRPFAPTLDEEDLYVGLPTMLDTLDSDILVPALFARMDAIRISGSTTYTVHLINVAADTLTCIFHRRGSRQPFNLPWTIRYGETEFRTFNIELARMLMKLLPEDRYRDEKEEKLDLLYAVAWRLAVIRNSPEEGK